MRKIRVFTALILAVFLLSSCAAPEVETVSTQPSTEIATVPAPTEPVKPVIDQKPMYAVSMPVTEVLSYAEDGTVIFRQLQQSIQLTAPDREAAEQILVDLMNRIDPEAESIASLESFAASQYAGSVNGFPYFYQNILSPTRVDQNVFSFFGTSVSYAGTPHPETVYQSVTYSPTTGRILTAKDIFIRDLDITDFLSLVIEYLSDIPQLYEGYEDTVSQRFKNGPTEDTQWYFSRDGLCVYFDPYEIAPYASGVVTATIPYEKLVGILTDGCFLPETMDTTGTLYATGEPQEAFTQLCEVLITPGADQFFLYTDGITESISIATGSLGGEEFKPDTVIFATAQLTPGDAVMIEANANAPLQIQWYDHGVLQSRIFTPEYDLYHAPVL